jgi:hypothetical protein
MKFKTGKAGGLYRHLAKNARSRENILDLGKLRGKAPKACEALLKEIMVPNGWSICEFFTLHPVTCVAHSLKATQVPTQRGNVG